MEMQRVKSSNVHSVGYEPAAKRLHVQFLDGAGGPGPTYPIENVSAQEHAAFLAAKSKGKHFHKTFKSRAGVKLAA